MTAKAVARVGDTVVGICRHSSHNGIDYPFSAGRWTQGSSIVTANGIGIVRQGDSGITECNHTFVAQTTSTAVGTESLPLHRVGDSVTSGFGTTGTTTTGSPTVTSL